MALSRAARARCDQHRVHCCRFSHTTHARDVRSAAPSLKIVLAAHHMTLIIACWDACVFRRMHCHADVTALWEHAPTLAEWLADVRDQWAQGSLLAGQAAQLSVLGVVPLRRSATAQALYHQL